LGGNEGLGGGDTGGRNQIGRRNLKKTYSKQTEESRVMVTGKSRNEVELGKKQRGGNPAKKALFQIKTMEGAPKHWGPNKTAIVKSFKKCRNEVSKKGSKRKGPNSVEAE